MHSKLLQALNAAQNSLTPQFLAGTFENMKT